MKNWRAMMAAKLGLSESAIAMRLKRGKLKPQIRRVHARLVYVIYHGN